MRFRNIIFDLDGTLIDSFKDVYCSFSSAAVHLGLLPPSQEEVFAHMHLRIDQLARFFYPDFDQNTMVLEFKKVYDNSGYPNTVLFPGVKETLILFEKNGYQCFIATNKRKKPAMDLISRLGLTDFIKGLETSDTENPPMKKQQILAKIILDYNLNPNTTIMVGDSCEDCNAAFQNNIRCIFVSYGYGKVDPGHYYDKKILKIDSFSKLLGFV